MFIILPQNTKLRMTTLFRTKKKNKKKKKTKKKVNMTLKRQVTDVFTSIMYYQGSITLAFSLCGFVVQ
jgi:hypothetical protein